MDNSIGMGCFAMQPLQSGGNLNINKAKEAKPELTFSKFCLQKVKEISAVFKPNQISFNGLLALRHYIVRQIGQFYHFITNFFYSIFTRSLTKEKIASLSVSSKWKNTLNVLPFSLKDSYSFKHNIQEIQRLKYEIKRKSKQIDLLVKDSSYTYSTPEIKENLLKVVEEHKFFQKKFNKMLKHQWKLINVHLRGLCISLVADHPSNSTPLPCEVRKEFIQLFKEVKSLGIYLEEVGISQILDEPQISTDLTFYESMLQEPYHSQLVVNKHTPLALENIGSVSCYLDSTLQLLNKSSIKFKLHLNLERLAQQIEDLSILIRTNRKMLSTLNEVSIQTHPERLTLILDYLYHKEGLTPEELRKVVTLKEAFELDPYISQAHLDILKRVLNCYNERLVVEKTDREKHHTILREMIRVLKVKPNQTASISYINHLLNLAFGDAHHQLFNAIFQTDHPEFLSHMQGEQKDPADLLKMLLGENLLNCFYTEQKVSSTPLIPDQQFIHNLAKNCTLQLNFEGESNELQGLINTYFNDRTEHENFTYREGSQAPIQVSSYQSSIQLRTLSDFMVVHLKRFSYDPVLGRKKIDTPVDLPSNGIIDFSNMYHPLETDEENKVSTRYAVTGYVIHKGEGTDAGHYIAYVKKGKRFWRCDDFGSPLYEEVSAEKFYGKKQAYIVFLKQMKQSTT